MLFLARIVLSVDHKLFSSVETLGRLSCGGTITPTPNGKERSGFAPDEEADNETDAGDVVVVANTADDAADDAADAADVIC